MKDVLLTLLLILGVYLSFVGFAALMIRLFFPVLAKKDQCKNKFTVRTVRV